MTRRRFGSALALLVASASLVACASAATVPTVTAPAGAPSPAGAVVPTAKPSASAVDTSFDPTASYAPTSGGATVDAIRARGTLRVGVDQNTYGFGYYDPAQGKIVGFDIAIAYAVAKAIFGGDDANAAAHTQLIAITSAQRVPFIQDKTVDMVVRTMTINCARWQQVNFSTVYYQAGEAVLTLKASKASSIDDFKGKRVCATAGSTSIVNIAAHGVIPVSVANWTDCLVLLEQHQIEAISTDDAILRGLAAQDPGTKLIANPDGSIYTFTSEPYGIATHGRVDQTPATPADNDFTGFINGVLAGLRAGGGAGWTAIYRAAGLPDPVPAVPVARYLTQPR